jgi:uncharacterized protein with HEPN domain
MNKSGKDNSRYLNHIIESIELINQYSSNMSKHDFYIEQEKQDAIIRRLEIIGEASKKLPENFRNKYSDVPWREMAGMRDILAHQYFGIDLEIAWETIKNKIPEIEPKIRKIYDIIKTNDNEDK